MEWFNTKQIFDLYTVHQNVHDIDVHGRKGQGTLGRRPRRNQGTLCNPPTSPTPRSRVAHTIRHNPEGEGRRIHLRTSRKRGAGCSSGASNTR